MGKINLLDQATINQIAAGEVVERPASVAKELVENAIDAGATAVTVEIKEGGISLLRVTDNGSGMEKDDIRTAFLRHATSKIKSALDLLTVGSLGFRGEALSSISAVAQVELLTKTKDAFVGSRYVIEGGEEKAFEEAGCPSGTTFLVRNLFYNVPARKKFLKTAMTEGGYINELMERMALSRPDISFKYMNNGKTVLHTTGGNELKDIIYHLFGRDIAMSVLPVNYPKDEFGIEISGYIGKPVIARGNRTQENYFINGRYIKCAIINRAIEDAYKSYMMGHKYPFTAIHITVPPEFIDVNVHPSKMELRFSNNEAIYQAIYQVIRDTLSGKNMIVPVSLSEKEDKQEQKKEILQQQKISVPEPFEVKRREYENPVSKPAYYAPSAGHKPVINVQKPLEPVIHKQDEVKPTIEQKMQVLYDVVKENKEEYRATSGLLNKQEIQQTTAVEHQETQQVKPEVKPEQITLPADLLAKDNRKEFTLIGQVFATYWLIEMEEQLFIVDQHAAHEKVLFERTMEKLRNQEEIFTQSLLPPMILSLTMREAECLKNNLAVFERLGFQIEEFGGLEFKVTEVPADLVTVDSKELLTEVLNSLLSERDYKNVDVLLEKVASLSCKAAVKGNHRMSDAEAKQLISDMLTLDNPYHCPHGRPTTISMSKYELERKFKRIV
ncbi:MAG: DNA mismatch repair endonuclease MutL [Lachnospiraceae bacterium]|nr:DNA mismatch repair endonuclease MutL [Lachnospiraceae bacterium]